jgi:hypothetical protein
LSIRSKVCKHVDNDGKYIASVSVGEDVLIDEIFESLVVLFWIFAADVIVEYVEEAALQSSGSGVFAEQVDDSEEIDFLFVFAEHFAAF